MTEPRFCPHCGSVLQMQDIYGSSLPVCEDAACGFEFWPCMYPAVAVVIENAQNQVLVVERANEPEKGRLDWPGGFLKYGELPEEAAVRESKEELGVTITLGASLGFAHDDYLYQEHNRLNLVVGYRARLAEDTELVIDPAEVTEPTWVDPRLLRSEQFAFRSGPIFLAKLLETI